MPPIPKRHLHAAGADLPANIETSESSMNLMEMGQEGKGAAHKDLLLNDLDSVLGGGSQKQLVRTIVWTCP